MKNATAKNDNSPVFVLEAGFQPKCWLISHLHAVIFTLGRLVRSPFNALTTMTVTGVVLALPAALYVLLDNIKTVTTHWDVGAQVSLYLDNDLTDDDAASMGVRLVEDPNIDRVEIITKAEALAEYQQLTGLSEVTLGGDNPLPPVVVVIPNPEQNNLAAIGQLVDRLRNEPGVDIVQSDMAWLARLEAITVILHRTVWLLAALFGSGVLLVVGNTIRLSIQNQHQEIEISKLVGATNAFICRPFLYSGLWCGLLGALFAWMLLLVIFGLLKSPVDELSALYHSHFFLAGPSNYLIIILLFGGGLLGLCGSWVTLMRHLGAIEPS